MIITRVLRRLQHKSLVSPDDEYDGPECRFMAVERWDSVVFIVVDLFNTDYNHQDAHLEGKNELPVRVANVSYRVGQYKVRVRETTQVLGRVGERIRELHDHNGWDQRVPFRTDHANGACPRYSSPRSMKIG